MEFGRLEMRELGVFRPGVFARRVRGAEASVKRLEFHTMLRAHDGPVNTVHFNQSGDILVSGSNTKVIFWKWSAQSQKLSYDSGHLDGVLRARILPFTDDRTVVTSGGDGQIRLGQIADDGETKTTLLGAHQGRVFNLTLEPGSPHVFYSCGEDGVVKRVGDSLCALPLPPRKFDSHLHARSLQFDLRSSFSTELLSCYSSDESREPVPLYAIAIDPRNPNYFSVGGLDKFARVYDVRNCWGDSTAETNIPVEMFVPPRLIRSDQVRVTGLAFSRESELLVSYNDELVYLFPKYMGPRHSPRAFSGHRNAETLKDVSFFGPNDEYVVSGSDCRRLFIWKKKNGELIRMMMGGDIVSCVEPHPHFPFLATAGLEDNVKLWMPTALSDAYSVPSNAGRVSVTNEWGREFPRLQASLLPHLIPSAVDMYTRQLSFFGEESASESATNNANVPDYGRVADILASVLESTDIHGASSQQVDDTIPLRPFKRRRPNRPPEPFFQEGRPIGPAHEEAGTIEEINSGGEEAAMND